MARDPSTEQTAAGLGTTRGIVGDQGGSYTWDPPIKDYEKDFPKMRFPEIKVDYDITHRVLEVAEELFGDILKGCHVEVIMKDNHTLGGSKENAVRWCRIAREEIERL
jgi:hypothetical protein